MPHKLHSTSVAKQRDAATIPLPSPSPSPSPFPSPCPSSSLPSIHQHFPLTRHLLSLQTNLLLHLLRVLLPHSPSASLSVLRQNQNTKKPDGDSVIGRSAHTTRGRMRCAGLGNRLVNVSVKISNKRMEQPMSECRRAGLCAVAFSQLIMSTLGLRLGNILILLHGAAEAVRVKIRHLR